MDEAIEHDICGEGRKIWTTPAVITATIVGRSEGFIPGGTAESAHSSIGTS